MDLKKINAGDLTYIMLKAFGMYLEKAQAIANEKGEMLHVKVAIKAFMAGFGTMAIFAEVDDKVLKEATEKALEVLRD